ncbi:MAG TPA: serine protease [Solirubrobacteraceae bacterium]|nr:serine protease [Solirubrobacteraceae bacterium]
MTARGFAALCTPALLAAAAIGHATAGKDAGSLAVVTVEARGGRTATGFLSSDGRVVTVAHAVGTGLVTVRGADGVGHQATVLRRDDALDLAVLLAPGVAGDRAAEPGDRLPVSRDAMRVVVRRNGTQVALPARVRRRIDAHVRTADGRLVARRPALELAVRIRAGDSGAPLVGPGGRVAGIVFARSRERPALAYAVDGAVLGRLLR